MSRLNSEMHSLLTESVLKSLFSKNIYTVLNFLQTELKQIGAITNLNYKDIISIRKHLINKHSAVVHTGLNYYNELIAKSALIPTGIKGLDEILQGGLMTGNTYEICGLPSSGKTQLCLTLLMNVVQNLNLYVYFIDTKRDIMGRKIKAMLQAKKTPEVKISSIMSKMLIKQIDTQCELINALYEIKDAVCTRKLKLRLLIIDSLPPLFYQSLDFAKNYSVMNNFVNIVNFMAKELHIAIIVTNVITTWYEGDFTNENTMSEKLGLGKYWINVANTRLLIKRITNTSECTITISKSNRLPKEVMCNVFICNEGIL